ncbi:MAG: hypothetical protein P8104_02740 [Gammaproteobacteria bacterium]
MKRREFFNQVGSYCALVGTASILYTSGGSMKQAVAAGKTIRMPSHAEIKDIATFYSDRAGTAQESQYNTKAYLAADTLAGGLGGLVLDTADFNHTPYVKSILDDPADDTLVNLNVVCSHAVTAAHNIAGVDIWFAGDAVPSVEFDTPAADITAGLTTFDYTIPVSKAQLNSAAFIILISHCNLHGGHMNFNDGFTLDT